MTDIPQRSLTRDPHENEFIQAVSDVMTSVRPVLDKTPEYRHHGIVERIVEPERIITFRVPGMDDMDQIKVNRGFRVEMNGAIGPYKGGLRFHPSVNQSILKFLAFEHVFENALTTLPLGGGVAVSGLELTQNSIRLSWRGDEVENRLKIIMHGIHDTCLAAANAYGRPGNYLMGANIAGFIKVADAMIDQGVI